LIADGTSLTTAALAPLAAGLDADDVADDDDADVFVLLLLPHPTTATVHSSGTAPARHVLSERITLLLD
jgi:hypothetical protein